jgi:hypothetical protein
MPLTSFQSDVLKLLSRNRSPDSYVAGAVALNRDGPRYSGDIDIFQDSEQRLHEVVEADTLTLRAAGFTVVDNGRQTTGKRSAIISGNNESTQIDWVANADFRFFPAITDELFGYVLHPIDLAANKASAAADRRVPRDIVDLVTIHETILPLGAVIWAAVGRFPGVSPEGMLDEIRRNSRFTANEFQALATERPIEPASLHQRIRAMLEDAAAFLPRMPSDLVGLVFLEDSKPVQPDPRRLESYQRHEGARRGHWPSSSEIGSAMLERYAHKPEQE